MHDLGRDLLVFGDCLRIREEQCLNLPLMRLRIYQQLRVLPIQRWMFRPAFQGALASINRAGNLRRRQVDISRAIPYARLGLGGQVSLHERGRRVAKP